MKIAFHEESELLKWKISNFECYEHSKLLECPECGKDLEILVNKQEKLVTDKTCACGEVLKKDSDYSDYR